jgi:hypothetical protein
VLRTQSITNQSQMGAGQLFIGMFSKFPQSYLNSGTADSFCNHSICQGTQHMVNASVFPEYLLRMVLEAGNWRGLPAVRMMCHFTGGHGCLLNISRRHLISSKFLFLLLASDKLYCFHEHLK